MTSGTYIEPSARTATETPAEPDARILVDRAMRTAEVHLERLASRLQRAGTPLQVSFPVPGVGPMDDLEQCGYNLERSDDGRSLTLSYCYRVRDIRSIPTVGDMAYGAGLREIGGGVLRYRSVASRVHGATFQVEAFIPVTVRLEVDDEAGAIWLVTTNLSHPTTERRLFAPRKLALEVLVELMKQIEQRRSSFVRHTTVTVPEELRSRLRAELAAQEDERKRLLETPMQRALRWVRESLVQPVLGWVPVGA